MLSPSDVAFLDANAYSVDHDYNYLPRLLGEPYVEDGTVSYFDGRSVHIMGAVIPWQPASAQQKLVSVTKKWMRDERVEFINYFAPIRPDWLPNEDYTIEYSEDGIDHNVELFVDLSVMPSAKVARKQRKALARARRRGIVVKIRTLTYFSHSHISLLRNCMPRIDYGVSDASYVLNVSGILSHPSTRVFEAMIGDQLVGLGVTHEYFRRRPFFLVAAFDQAALGCSDAIYGSVIGYYRNAGAQTLSLGYTPSWGNMCFKIKWGAAPRLPPSFQVILRRRGCESAFRESLHWPWSILADVWDA